MPTVNVYYKDLNKTKELENIVPELRTFIAEQLTCGDIKLSPNEISIRFINIIGGQTIGKVELEIVAAAFSERVKKQDEICLAIMKFIENKAQLKGGVKVWLKLSELGHSWES